MKNRPIDQTNTIRRRAGKIAAISRLYPFGFGYGTLQKLIDHTVGPCSGDVWIRIDGGEVLVPLEDLIGRTTYFFGDFDPRVSWVIERSAAIGDVALDVGANLGILSLKLAAAVGPKGHVHAFEPNPSMQQYLRATLQRNSRLPITVHPIGLGDKNEELTLSVAEGNAGSATLVDRANENFSSVANISVRPLSEYAGEIGLNRVDFIKIDVEGFEAQVLKGAWQLFDSLKPKVVVFEEHAPFRQNQPPPSFATLYNLGYRIFGLPRRIGPPRLVPASLLEHAHVTDYVAVSRGADDNLLRELAIAQSD